MNGNLPRRAREERERKRKLTKKWRFWQEFATALKHLAAEPVSSAAVGKGRGLMIRSENAYLFCAAIFTLKTIILPRQARVK
jgi:hypothetical protein